MNLYIRFRTARFKTTARSGGRKPSAHSNLDLSHPTVRLNKDNMDTIPNDTNAEGLNTFQTFFPASNRLPVEIWQKILSEAVDCPSLHAPSMKDGFMRNIDVFSSNQNDVVEKQRLQAEETRNRLVLVCRSWTHYLNTLPQTPPFIRIKELGNRSNILLRKGLLVDTLINARRLHLETTPFACGHRTTCWCSLTKENAIEYKFDREEQLKAAKICVNTLRRSHQLWKLEMLFIEDDIPIDTLLFNISKLPNLKVLKYPTARQPTIDLDWFSADLTNLTHLLLRFDGRPVQGSLRLPNLHTFQIIAGPQDAESIHNWELPSLRYVSCTRSPACFSLLRRFGPQLTGVQLALRSWNDTQENLWALCPNLELLGFDDIPSTTRVSSIANTPLNYPLKAVSLTFRTLGPQPLPPRVVITSSFETISSWNIQTIYVSMPWANYHKEIMMVEDGKRDWWMEFTLILKNICQQRGISLLDSRCHSLDSIDGQELAIFMQKWEQRASQRLIESQIEYEL